MTHMEQHPAPHRRPHNQLGSKVLAVISRQAWLDRPSYRLENVLSLGYNAFGRARNRVTNTLHGVWLGHPVHPPLASLASGVLGTTVALDVLHAASGRHRELLEAARLARFTLGMGILVNLGAALTGMTDWQHTHEKDRRVGLVHGLLNSAATALYVLSWMDRGRGRLLRAGLTSTVGYGISLGSGYLGGHLVFASGLGTDQSGRRLDLQEWTPVVRQDDLTARKLQRVEVDGVGLVLCRTENGVSAVGEFCPHLAAPMVDGWLDRGRIVCPWHGSQFDPQTGQVVRGPASAPLSCYQTRTRDGVIELRGSSDPGTPGTERHNGERQAL